MLVHKEKAFALDASSHVGDVVIDQFNSNRYTHLIILGLSMSYGFSSRKRLNNAAASILASCYYCSMVFHRIKVLSILTTQHKLLKIERWEVREETHDNKLEQ